MNRISFAFSLFALLLIHAACSQVAAQNPKPPTGGRVAYMLLVNGAVTDAVVKAANIAGHQSVNPPYVGTWHSFVKGLDAIQPGRLDPVEKGQIDVMLIGTLMSYPNAETWKNHLGPNDSTLAGLAALGVKNNPKFRIVWQTYVWPVGQTPKDGKKTLDVAAMKKRAANEPLNELEMLVDAINEKHGRQVVLISPVGIATIKLVELVADGKFPGLSDPADLWTEFNMHSNRHVLALTAYCNVATMYGVSPVGLKPDFSKITYGGGGKGPGIQSMEGITDEQRAILQNIAWETVSQYRHSVQLSHFFLLEIGLGRRGGLRHNFEGVEQYPGIEHGGAFGTCIFLGRIRRQIDILLDRGSVRGLSDPFTFWEVWRCRWRRFGARRFGGSSLHGAKRES